MKTVRELIKFEEDVVQMYKDGLLRSPIHLSGSVNMELENFLISYFNNGVKENDWIFTVYRSHYHALLKGMPEERLKNWILDNKSIHVMDSEYRIFSTAIVGGHLSVALGAAMAIKMQGTDEHVHVFCGDMTFRTGVFWECLNYARQHRLPITFIIEDNGLSTDTPTKEVWQNDTEGFYDWIEKRYGYQLRYVKYTRHYPHYGCGLFVDFKDEGLKQEGKF